MKTILALTLFLSTMAAAYEVDGNDKCFCAEAATFSVNLYRITPSENVLLRPYFYDPKGKPKDAWDACLKAVATDVQCQ